jgi:glucokinase
LNGSDPLAGEALDVWISVYGAEAGNLALKAMALGGIFLGGGISPKILPKLTGPKLMEAFLNKGRLRPVLENISVQVITNDKAGLLGAARYAANKCNPVFAGAS